MMDYSLINKYLAGEASEEEVSRLFEWIELSEENKTEFIQYKKIWALTSMGNEDLGKAWETLFFKGLGQARKYHRFVKIAGYAAIILLLITTGALAQYFVSSKHINAFSYQAETRIEVPAGQMSKILLPDGSTVQLNSGTTLSYSSDFNSGQRVVHLNGEAYFDVAKDKAHPFFVKTNSLDFKVYGTSFNIQAYPDDEELNATLIEGSLGVFGKNDNEYSRLKPGENVQYNLQSKIMHTDRVNIDMYISWKDGLITFRNERLKEIAAKIERWYNVEIVFQNEELANELYMGTIMKSKPIDQILEVFRLTSSLNYRIVQRPDKPNLIYWE